VVSARVSAFAGEWRIDRTQLRQYRANIMEAIAEKLKRSCTNANLKLREGSGTRGGNHRVGGRRCSGYRTLAPHRQEVLNILDEPESW
jgi:hypothetical protein